MNHNKERESAIDWTQFLMDAETLLSGENVLIKKDLEKFRPKEKK